MPDTKIDPNDIEIRIKGKRMPWHRADCLKGLMRKVDFSIKRCDCPNKESTETKENT